MELLEMIKDCLDRVKAEDIKVYDFKGRSPLYDFAIIATVGTGRAADAVVGYIDDEATKNGFDVKGIEGKGGSWTLIDLHDAIVHIFTPEDRKLYDLDKLYMNIPLVK